MVRPHIHIHNRCNIHCEADDSLTKLRDAVLTLSIDSVRTVILGAIAAQSGEDRVMF